MRYIVRSVDGDEYGPFDRKELQRLVTEQRLGPGDFIRRESGRTWSPFEKIAGLAEESSVSTAGIVDAPIRPRVDPRPEVLGLDSEPDPPVTASPRFPRTRIDADMDRSDTDDDSNDLIELTPSTFGAASERDDDGTGDEPQPNPFTRLGLPIRLEEGEQVRFVIIQSFLDALRESPFNAILGHRGTLICTDARVVVARPSLIRPSMAIVWLSSAGSASLETRRRIIRLILGLLFLFNAFSILVSGPITNGVMEALTGSSSPAGSIVSGLTLSIGAICALLGLLLVATASARSMVVTATGAEAVFGCARIGPWHLSQIDAGHAIAYRKGHPAGDGRT